MSGKGEDIKTPIVNSSCIGCGACVSICPDVFDFDDDGKAFSKEGMNTSNASGIDDAISSCPVDAISYKD